MKPFSRLRILEIAGSPAGGYAGKLFADYGAEVLLLEPPGGSSIRNQGSNWHGVGSLWAYLNTSKRAVELDCSTEAGREELQRLGGLADVVLESSSPDPLSPLLADSEMPTAVHTLISPLGLEGPRSYFRSNEFTDEALGGHLYLNGDADREPISRPGYQAHYQAGAHAFIGSLSALLARDHSGLGQTVEVTHLEGLAAMHQYTTVMWTQASHILRRVGNNQGGPWHPVGNYPCKDGYVSLAMPVTVMLEPFLEAAGLAHLLDDERFSDDVERARHRTEFDAAIQPWLLAHTADEIIDLGQQVAAPVGPVKSFLETLEDPHLKARGFWKPLGEPSPLLFPRGPFLIQDREPSPRVNLPLSRKQAPNWTEAPSRAVRSDGRRLKDGPLDGIRIVDLTRVWAGPLASRMLGDLGADVIRIEATWARGDGVVTPEQAQRSHMYPEGEAGRDPYNRNVSFNKLNRNKRGLTLELATDEGKEIFASLVKQADVVIENFSPHVMGSLGFDWNRLQKLNPNVVYVSMPGFGSTGPYRDWLAFGPLIEAASGLANQIGYADSGPYRSGLAWPDPVTSLHAVAATLIALAERESDPERRGRWAEVPMLEALQCFNGDQILEAQIRGSVRPRSGNRHPERAPQGCYRCQGEDRWLAISIETDAEWRALCRVACLDPRFEAMRVDERRSQHDDIDNGLGAWTRSQDASELMQELQSKGIIAAVVADAELLVNDPQLAERGFWVELDHRSVGRRIYPGLPIRFSATPATYRRAAPCLGEHNREILGDLLGLDEERIRTLYANGIVTEQPPPGSTFRGIQKQEEPVGASDDGASR